MHNIMVLNAKGGCGKTTIATTLACYFAGEGYSTALMDFDPQNSSNRWLEMRTTENPTIKAIEATRPRAGMTRSYQLYSGNGTEVVVIDTPAGVSGGQLVDHFNRADTILVPVMSTFIDYHAVARFLDELMRLAKHRTHGKRLGLVANRVRLKSKPYQMIQELARELEIPLIASLRDTQNYSIAMEAGQGICELKPSVCRKDMQQWQPLIDWLLESIPAKKRPDYTQTPDMLGWPGELNSLAS